MVQVLVVRVDIGVVTYVAMTSQCWSVGVDQVSGRSVLQGLVVRVDIGLVIYEAVTPECERSVVQVCMSELI